MCVCFKGESLGMSVAFATLPSKVCQVLHEGNVCDIDLILQSSTWDVAAF